jgi:hypothetical protein
VNELECFQICRRPVFVKHGERVNSVIEAHKFKGCECCERRLIGTVQELTDRRARYPISKLEKSSKDMIRERSDAG